MDETQQRAVDLMVAGRNVFLTGGAGSGKSFTLKHGIDVLRRKQGRTVVVTAATAIAALNVGGKTIHSAFGISSDMVGGKRKKSQPYDKISKTFELLRDNGVLVIEEVSTLPKDLWEFLYSRGLAHFGTDVLPFQIIVCGDFFQTPPISNSSNKIEYAFQSDCWAACRFEMVELERSYRVDVSDRQDAIFYQVLNKFRLGQPTEADVLLITQEKKDFDEDSATWLMQTNNDVSTRNATMLAKLEGPEFEFKPVWNGVPFPKEIDKQLEGAVGLKVGARVILKINVDQDRGLVNGRIGQVTAFKEDTKEPLVVFDGEVAPVLISPVQYKFVKNGATSTFTFLPLRLAWAMTIHSCIGVGLLRVVVFAPMEMGGNAAPIVYTALSRAKSFDGLLVKKIPPVKPNDPVITFYKAAKNIVL